VGGGTGPRRCDSPQRLRSEFVPALGGQFADTLGVDEAFLSAAALTLANGGALPLATYLSAAAAAIATAGAGRTLVKADRLQAWLDARAELRTQSRFLPDAATIADIAQIAPPLPPTIDRPQAEPAWVRTDSGKCRHAAPPED
jgi:hypothetical protein